MVVGGRRCWQYDDTTTMIASMPFVAVFGGRNSGRKSMNIRMAMMMVNQKQKCSASYERRWSASTLFGYCCLVLVIFFYEYDFHFVNCSETEIFPQPSSSVPLPISVPFGLVPSTVSPTMINCTVWNPFHLWTKSGNRKHKRSLMFKRKRLKERRKRRRRRKNDKKNQGNKRWPMFNNDTANLFTSGHHNDHHPPHDHDHGHPYDKDNNGHFINGHPQQSIYPQIPSSSYYHHYYYNNNPNPQQQDELNQNQGLIIHPSALAATAAMPFHLQQQAQQQLLQQQQQQPPIHQQLPQRPPFLLPLTSASSSQESVEFSQQPDDPFFMVEGGPGNVVGSMAASPLYPYHHGHQPHAHPSILYPTIYDFEDYHHLRQHDPHHQHDQHHHHKDHMPLDYDPMMLDGTNESEEQLDHKHKGHGQHRKQPQQQNHLNHHHHHHHQHGHHGGHRGGHHHQHHHKHHHQHHRKHENYGPRLYRRPVAKDLISDKPNNDNYYEPFPVDPIRGYYLGESLSSSTAAYEEEEEDAEEDNGDDGGGGGGGGGGEEYNGHGHDDHDDHGGYNGQDSGQNYNEINHHHHHHKHDHDHKKCYRRKQWNQNDLDWAMKQAYAKMKWYSKTIQKNALDTKRRTPYIPYGVLDAKIWEYATYYLKQRLCLTKMDVVKMLPKIDSKKILENQYEMYACRQESYIICEPKARYRSIDGACNNLKKKTWSKSFTCHRRLLPPDYADGVAEPRQSYHGVGKLPNARDISSLLLPDIDVPDQQLTSMAMAFGQFIIHDVARTLPTANDIRCCPVKQASHPECLAIEIRRPDDVLRKYYNQTCMNFVRSVVCNPCGLGPREQQNQATHTFDLSQMYGLRLNDSLPLRTFRGGKLRGSWTSTFPKEELPPKMVREDPGCNIRPKPPRFKCFETADGIRASQHPALQSMHTVFHRRHNQHTDGLAKVNPHWSDEKLYQEARHITIAEVSNMIYGQYLSSVFGQKLMKHFRLDLKKQGYSKYNPKLNPSTLQEFIVAAGRFGHSQINKQFRVVFNDPKLSYSYRLRDNFFETTIVSLGHSGGILKGLSLDSTQASDPYFVDDVKNSLYHLRKERLGRDLPAFNIQRGREHGVPGYVYYLDFCFGFKVYNWNDLAEFIPAKHLKKIRLFYRHWNDIDLFVGGVFERLMDGAAFGPTFGCINGIQFYNFKYGDRFYFEHGYQSGSFNIEQLNNIRKVSTLSSIICKTHPEMDQMPSNAFVKTSPLDNPLVPCFKFPELDYNLWLDTRHQQQRKRKPKADENDPPKSNGGKLHPQSSNVISEHQDGGDHNNGEDDFGGRTTSSPYLEHKYGYSKHYHYEYRNDEYPDQDNQTTTPTNKKQQEEDNYWDFGYKQDIL